MENNRKYIYNYSCFKNDSIDLLSKQNKKYYKIEKKSFIKIINGWSPFSSDDPN